MAMQLTIIKGNHDAPLFDMIIDSIPPPGDPSRTYQMLVSSLSYSQFLGRLAIGKITSKNLGWIRNVLFPVGSAHRLRA